MNPSLISLNQWLKEHYGALGIVLGSAIDRQNVTAWNEVDENKADLLDSEIGIWTRFIALTSAEAVSELVRTDVRWALEKLSRLDVRSGVPEAAQDSFGAWQVHLIWIVPQTCKAEWEKALRDLRNKSAHPEEVGIDFIDVADCDIRDALSRDGIPSLLLQARALLRKSLTQMPAWLSPDVEFIESLKASVDSITEKDQKLFATDFITQADDLALDSQQGSSGLSSRQVANVKVRNFRNIVEAELPLETCGGALIIHGPNGSGKSSLFEAVSLALLGTSKRYCEFLSDRDVLPNAKGNYLRRVLTRYRSGEGSHASVLWDGAESLQSLVGNADVAKDMLVGGRGTLLAQEAAREFLEMSSAELASFVLGDYSPRARRIQSEADKRFLSARSDWQEWLRSYGLSAAITKSGTILRKLVGRTVADNCPPEPQAPILWMHQLGERLPEFAVLCRTIRTSWEIVDSIVGREAVVEQTAASIEKTGNGERPISNWLIERNSLSKQIIELIDAGNLALDPIKQEWAIVKSDLLAWVKWLRRPVVDAVGSGLANKDDVQRSSIISSRLAELSPLGTLLRARKDHLSYVKEKLLAKWMESHAHTCPTCNAEHAEQIADVVNRIAISVDEEYSEVRTEYARLAEEQRQLREKATEDVSNCPISDERIAELAHIFRMPVSGTESLEAQLVASQDFADTLFSSFERLFVPQVWKEPLSTEGIESLARDMSTRILALRAEGFAKQELPLRWEALKKTIDETALGVVSNHLPKTVGAIWRELSACLAPSRWNQSSQLEMAMELKRGAEKLGIVMKRDDEASRIPARHILNQAEQHVLGLAWFFTRHLTHGRFLIPFVALDDPAQEMDQVTYRKFVRFLQAFQRVHKVLSAPFNMLVFLHQEERALDLARATSLNGALTILEWSQEIRSSGPASTVHVLQLRNPEQTAPLPLRAEGVSTMV